MYTLFVNCCLRHPLYIFGKMRQIWRLKIDQCYLAIARQHTGSMQSEVTNECCVSQSINSRLQQRYQDTWRVNERPRSGCSRCTSCNDDRLIVNPALWNWMSDASQLQTKLREFRGTWVSCQTIPIHLHKRGLNVRPPAIAPDHNARHMHHCY